MNKISIISYLITIITLAFFFTYPAGANDKAKKMIVIIGKVTENGEIAADNGEIFAIGINRIGTKLIKLVGARVEAKGIVSERGVLSIIYVESFILLVLNSINRC